MTTVTAKIKRGAIELPRELKKDWQNADVFLRFSGDTLVIKKAQKQMILGEEETLISTREFKTFKPTKVEVMALEQARKNYKSGNYMTLDEFERKLGFKN